MLLKLIIKKKNSVPPRAVPSPGPDPGNDNQELLGLKSLFANISLGGIHFLQDNQ